MFGSAARINERAFELIEEKFKGVPKAGIYI
jgi:hypothetical protein